MEVSHATGLVPLSLGVILLTFGYAKLRSPLSIFDATALASLMRGSTLRKRNAVWRSISVFEIVLGITLLVPWTVVVVGGSVMGICFFSGTTCYLVWALVKRPESSCGCAGKNDVVSTKAVGRSLLCLVLAVSILAEPNPLERAWAFPIAWCVASSAVLLVFALSGVPAQRVTRGMRDNARWLRAEVRARRDILFREGLLGSLRASEGWRVVEANVFSELVHVRDRWRKGRWLVVEMSNEKDPFVLVAAILAGSEPPWIQMAVNRIDGDTDTCVMRNVLWQWDSLMPATALEREEPRPCLADTYRSARLEAG